MKTKLSIAVGIILLFVALIKSFGCGERLEQNASSEYLNEIEQWHKKRIENLKKENGWLNLIGLYWLKEGENKFGSDKANDIVFPESAPHFIGSFILKDSIIKTNILPNISVMLNDSIISEVIMKDDLTGDPTVLKLGSLRWFIIKRGERYGVRLRDLQAKLVSEFQGIERFPVNEDWRIEALFKPYEKPQKIMVPNVLGTEDEEIAPGKLFFNINSEEYSLEPLDSGEKLFIIFADETNGETTYGAGRFLYTDKPDSSGKVILDFNKAYNPPCAFTKYATCPLPPEQNRLPLKITAGEKNFGAH